MCNSGNPRSWSASWLSALLAALPIVVLFWPLLLTDRSPAMRDAAHFYHPLLKWTSDAWNRGAPPLWNPYENAGMPLLADASSSLLYPGRLIFLAPLDFAWNYNLYLIGHVALAAMGSYLLARHWQAGRPAATCAAIAYSCSGSVVFQHSNAVFLIGAAWLPFAAWATDSLLAQRSYRAALGLGIVLALMVLGGDPQMAYHVILMGALYAPLAVRAKEPAIARRFFTTMGSIGRNLGLIFAAAAIGAALSAVQILPSLEAAAASERSYFDRPRNVYEAVTVLTDAKAQTPQPWSDVAGGIFGQPAPSTHHERLYDFSVAPWRLIECLWPNVGGRMFPTHRRWLSLVPAEGRIWTPSLYLGLLPLLLALSQWRLWRAPPWQAWLSWLLLLFALGSFGWYGLGWCVREFAASVLGAPMERMPIGSPVGGVYWLFVTLLPGYASFRYPAKLVVVAMLAASQLAAQGFDRSLAAGASRLLMVIRTLAVASIGLLAFCWIGFTCLDHLGPESAFGQRVGHFLAGQRDPSLGPFDWRGCQRDVTFAFVQTIVICLGAHCVLRTPRSPEPGVWHWTFTALIAADLAAANYWLVPTAPADVWRSQPSAAAAIQADYAPESHASGDPSRRVFRADLMRWRPESFARRGDPKRLAQLAAWERDTLFPKYGLPYGISLVESYGSLKAVDYESLLYVARSYGPAVEGSRVRELPHPAVLRLLGTEYLLVPSSWKMNPSDAISLSGAAATATNVPLPEGAALWRLRDPLPRSWIVHRVERLPELRGRHLAAVDQRARDVLFPLARESGERVPRDFRRNAVVETDLPLELPAGPELLAGEQCRIVRYDLDRVEIEATLAAPGMVVLSDRYAPGWIATVETAGQVKEVPILRTDRVFRGILLPPGSHRLQFAYRPSRFRTGAWISGLGWAALLSALVAALVRRGLAVGRSPTLRAGERQR